MLVKLSDRIQITTKRHITDEGFLVVPAKISRTGIQEYYALELGLTDRKPTDVVRVYRPEEEVFKDESLLSFANKVVTNDHPPEMVNVDNVKEYQIGFSGSEVVRKGIYAETFLTITDKEGIKAIESGKVEISNGYTSDIDFTPGVSPEGERYDCIQKNIRGNHIALVDNGRCGSACKVSDSKTTKTELTMKLITIDGVDFEVSDQAGQAVLKLQARLTDMEKETEEAKMDMEIAQEELKKKEDEMEKEKQKTEDSMRAQLDDAKSKVPTPEMLDKLVENRMATRDAALKINPEFDYKGKDCETIRKEIVADACPEVDAENESAEYIRARFDSLVANPNIMDEAFRKGAQSKEHTDGEKVGIADTARQKWIERNNKAWNPKGAK